MAKIRIIIEAEYSPEKSDYTTKFVDGEEVDTTEEEREAFTTKDLLKLDKEYLENGAFDLEEFFYSLGDIDNEKDVTFEVVEE